METNFTNNKAMYILILINSVLVEPFILIQLAFYLIFIIILVNMKLS
jgi:hypothetical protein